MAPGVGGSKVREREREWGEAEEGSRKIGREGATVRTRTSTGTGTRTGPRDSREAMRKSSLRRAFKERLAFSRA